MRNSLILNMAKKRMRAFIIKLLKEKGPMDTHAIHDALKKKFRQGACTNEVGGVLGRTKGIKKVGMREETTNMTLYEHRIRCAIWEYQD